VDNLYKAYKGDDEMIIIIFEGSDDEYQELAYICGNDSYGGQIEVRRGGRVLENAREILPDIKEVYTHVQPLVTTSVEDLDKVRREMEQFTDASKDVIPICVMGNYSAGKSTFINALIGSEILPSGDDPVTAKVFQIMQADSFDLSFIELRYDNSLIRINLTSSESDILTELTDNPLVLALEEMLSESTDMSISERMNSALTIINGFETDSDTPHLADIITLAVPFTGGLWKHYAGSFVIYDTPGSNSASNERHFAVLKSAMEGQTNGLPVYVAEFNTLDSVDNERLYRVIRELDSLDDRFTMIVVNKADSASLPKAGFSEKDIRRVRDHAIPRSLYAEGIFFVSSVMGLGAKTDGEFTDDHYAEIFEDQYKKYTDPASRFYKRLYSYNIMPGQLQEHALQAAEACEDLVYANSGLYSVEQEILTFATKYAAYNKCYKSREYLMQIIEITETEIAAAQEIHTENWQQLNNAMEEDKKELIRLLKEKGDSLYRQFQRVYDPSMTNPAQHIRAKYHQDSLFDELEEFQSVEGEKHGLSMRKAAVEESKAAIKDHFFTNLKRFANTPGTSMFKSIGTGLVEDTRNALGIMESLRFTKKQIEQSVSEDMFQMIIEDYNYWCDYAQSELDKASKEYWAERTRLIREALGQVVSGAESLTEAEKKELSDIIISYQELEFAPSGDSLFIREEFATGIRLGDVRLGNTDQLRLTRLRDRYNMEMAKAVMLLRESIGKSHQTSVMRWLEDLMQKLEENIVDYNPALKIQAAQIRAENEKLRELEDRQTRLENYCQAITRMMDWKQI